MSDRLPVTLGDWRRAYADGASPTALLSALRDKLEALGAPVFLHVASRAALDRQLSALAQQLAERDLVSVADIQKAFPLYGVPFVVKDNIDVGGEPTTAACPAFAYTASESATVVRRLIQAGAVWLGKTNLDQFATGLVGTRSPFGAPSSALSAEHISGGSSSGSAVAVAQGLVPIALGTDTAGSGRIPAGFNQVVGLKPTPGRVPNTGVVPACRSLDCVAVFALTVDDAAEALAVIEGHDPEDIYSRVSLGPPALRAHCRVGIPAAWPDEMDVAAKAGFAAAREVLGRLIHEVVPLDFSLLYEVAELLYAGPWVAERHWVVGGLMKTQPERMDPTVLSVISRASEFSATQGFAAQYRLRELAQRAKALWQQVDVLMVPTAPRHPTLAEVAAEPVAANTALGRFTNFVNLLGWSALAVPAGQRPDGLPFGVTFIGPADMDAALARLGREWQRQLALPLGATGQPLDPDSRPALWPATVASLPMVMVGAHLQGLPLNSQLTERGATLLERTQTAASYRLYELPRPAVVPGQALPPRKPGLVRVNEGGAAIEVEVWSLPLAEVGSFLALIPSPLSIGRIELQDGRALHGFLCEPAALVGARDITVHGGWRAWLANAPETAPAGPR